MQPAQHWESVYSTMERHKNKAGRQGDEYLHGSLLCRREADSRNPCCAGTLAASGGTTGGGGVMRWLEKEFGDWEREEGKRRGVSSLELMNEEAKVIPAGSDGVVFLPYMSGERSPIWDPDAKGVYYGLDFSKKKGI